MLSLQDAPRCKYHVTPLHQFWEVLWSVLFVEPHACVFKLSNGALSLPPQTRVACAKLRLFLKTLQHVGVTSACLPACGITRPPLWVLVCCCTRKEYHFHGPQLERGVHSTWELTYALHNKQYCMHCPLGVVPDWPGWSWCSMAIWLQHKKGNAGMSNPGTAQYDPTSSTFLESVKTNTELQLHHFQK